MPHNDWSKSFTTQFQNWPGGIYQIIFQHPMTTVPRKPWGDAEEWLDRWADERRGGGPVPAHWAGLGEWRALWADPVAGGVWRGLGR
jgi:hypothetical protein